MSVCEITTTGAISLAESLINNHSIKSLHMWDKDIAVDGAIAILKAAVTNGLCQEVITDDKVKELMSVLEETREEVRSIVT